MAKEIEAGRDYETWKGILEENVAETALEIYRKPMLVRHNNHVHCYRGSPVVDVVH